MLLIRRDFQQGMKFFDLHCDTVVKAMSNRCGFKDSRLHINPEQKNLPQKWEQCFALWQDDSLCGADAFEKCRIQLEFYKKELLPFFNGNSRAHLTIENARALGDDVDNVYFFKQEGVEIMALTWNGENALGYGAACEEKRLKPFGKRCLKELENAGIIIDVSHLNKTGFCDVCKVATKPFVASHSNCSAVYRHKRNLDRWQIEQIKQCNGLIGVCFYDAFLGSGKVDTFRKIYENIYFLLSVGAEKCICFGSDFDGARLSSAINSIQKVESLYFYLLQTDIPSKTVEDIFYNNARDFFSRYV